jgi:uncharacterized protein YggE
MKLFRLAAVAAGIAAVVVFAGVGAPGFASGDTTPSSPARSITVSGTGSVKVTPNEASFTFGVSSRGKTAVQALAANSADMTKLIAALKAAGIPAASLQTSSVSLSAITSDSDQAIVGYSASNSVSVTISNLGRAGQIVDTAVTAGANEVDGPNLTVSDQDALYHAALKAAVADARAKADVLADASGSHVGSVISVEEEASSSPVNYDTSRAALPATGPPIEPGTSQVTASVTVEFAVS